jgi:hypothetical protein
MKSAHFFLNIFCFFALLTACAAPATPEPTIAPTKHPVPTATWTPAPTPTETVTPTPTPNPIVDLVGGGQARLGTADKTGVKPVEEFLPPTGLQNDEQTQWKAQFEVYKQMGLDKAWWGVDLNNALELRDEKGETLADWRLNNGEGYVSWDWKNEQTQAAILSLFAEAPKGTINTDGFTHKGLGGDFMDALRIESWSFVKPFLKGDGDTTNWYIVLLARPDKQTGVDENTIAVFVSKTSFSTSKEYEENDMEGVMLSRDDNGSLVAINVHGFRRLFKYLHPPVPVKEN